MHTLERVLFGRAAKWQSRVFGMLMWNFVIACAVMFGALTAAVGSWLPPAKVYPAAIAALCTLGFMLLTLKWQRFSKGRTLSTALAYAASVWAFLSVLPITVKVVLILMMALVLVRLMSEGPEPKGWIFPELPGT